jgi:hypothetical protein
MTSGYDIQNEHYEDINENHVEFMAACAGFPMPDEIDPRKWYHIEMQYQMSSCVGNALTGPFEFAYRAATGNIAQFSRMGAYIMSQKYSDIVQPGFNYLGHDGGALIAGARRAAIEHGDCFESFWPYPKNAQYSTNVPKGEEGESSKFKMRTSSVIQRDGNPYEQAKTYLGTNQGGLIVGAPWPFNIGPNSTVTNFRYFGSQGHAWTILGYLRDGRLIAANSHDVGFQDKGFFYLDPQGFNEMVANRGTTVVGLSDLTTPRGRHVDWSKESMFS